MMQVDRYNAIRCRYEDGVLAYFLRRTGSADLAWELAAETWACAELQLSRRNGVDPTPAWLFAIARETLCRSLRGGRVADGSRRKAGCGRVELTEAGARWVRDVATEDALAALVAGLQPALREAVLAPVPRSDAEALAARLRMNPAPPAGAVRAALRRSPVRARMGLAR
jgi:DNA-directed RNA polymerase specialized sigma24 family protein